MRAVDFGEMGGCVFYSVFYNYSKYVFNDNDTRGSNIDKNRAERYHHAYVPRTLLDFS